MSRTVLVVEDDFDTLHPLAEMLRLRDFTVITASDAERALDTARKQSLDLIITDIVLPGRSGLHFIQALRKDKHTATTPIIVISGCGPMILVEAEASGANYCLEKPINIELFWAAIDSVFASRNSPEARSNDESQESGRALAGEIDRLVEALRNCATRADREDILKQLKQRILEFQSKNRNCA
jgi:DNA-binding response OmpR family regulator